MVSLRDVAEAAEVSAATVSHVINGTRYVSPELTARVQRALRDTGYKPNLVARSLRTQHSQTIALITSDITNPFYPGVAQGANSFSEQYGYGLILCDIEEDSAYEEKTAFWLQQKRVDGLLFTSIHMDSPTILALHEDRYPFVLINRKRKGLQTNYVGIDNRDGMAQSVRHLAGLGHRTVGFIAGPSLSTAAHERMDGFFNAAQEHGLEIHPSLVYNGSYRMDDGYGAVLHFLRVRPDITAIVAANDMMAFGAWQCLHRLGIEVPLEVSIAGFDDIPPASMGPVGLTTVRGSQHTMGRLAARLLIDTIEAETYQPPQQIVLPAPLIVRDTTAARRKRERLEKEPEVMARLGALLLQTLQQPIDKEVS